MMKTYIIDMHEHQPSTASAIFRSWNTFATCLAVGHFLWLNNTIPRDISAS